MTILQERYQVAFGKKVYDNLEILQTDLDNGLNHHNTERTHQGKMCCGRTPMQTLIEGKQIRFELIHGIWHFIKCYKLIGK